MSPHTIQRFRALALLLAFSLLAGSAMAQPPLKPKPVTSIEGITEYRLDNGVRYLLFPDPTSAKVTVNMTILVGSRHEGYGETGMAHLLEHMLFKGSKKFPDMDRALQKHGAARSANGTTYTDRTNYYETMPAGDENLKFGIEFEADRLVNCFIRRDDLVKEMPIVRNEFESGENNPVGILSQRMMATAFEWHNYGKNTIGNRSDIERVPINRLVEFYRKFYQPDNVLVVIAGKFDEVKAHQYMGEFFGAIPRPKRILDNTYTEEPPQDGERTVILRRVGSVAVAGLLYHTPSAAHPDSAAIQVLDYILTDEPSGRLYKALVETKKATDIGGYGPLWHDPAIFEVIAKVADKVTPEEVRDILIAEVEGFGKKPATDAEVARAKAKILTAWEQAFSKSDRIAINLSEWAGAGDWRLLFLYRDRVAKLTTREVNEAAARYFTQSNRTVGLFYPTKKPMQTPIPEAPDLLALLKNYKGQAALAMGEVFEATAQNIEKRTKHLTLSSGAKAALLSKKTRGETVIAQMSLHFGNEQSLKDVKDAAAYVGALMTRGTKKYTREEIADLLTKLNAKLSVSTSVGALSVSIEAKRKTLPAVLDLLEEVLRHPTFPEKELDILKLQEIQSLKEELTDPQSLAVRAVRRKLRPYPSDNIHYVPTIEESLANVQKVTRASVVKIYEEQIGGTVGEVAIVGDFEEGPAVKLLDQLLSGWKASVPYERISNPKIIEVKGSRETILTPGKENALYIGGYLLPLKDSDPQYPAFELANSIVGGSSFKALLYNRLRTRESLSYGTGSMLRADSRDAFGSFTVYAMCNPKFIEKADAAVADVLQGAVKQGVTAEQFEDAQKGYLQEQKLLWNRDSVVAGALRRCLELNRKLTFYSDQEERIAKLTLPEINQALRSLIQPGRLVIVRAGDFMKKEQPPKK